MYFVYKACVTKPNYCNEKLKNSMEEFRLYYLRLSEHKSYKHTLYKCLTSVLGVKYL